jgi:hypothetical protein
MSVTLSEFLAGVQAIRDTRPSYKLGHDGSDGQCDCIGLIIGGVRRSGGEWRGTHGSNYAARNEMAYLLPVTDEDDLNTGEVVYKAAMPGQTNYNLPNKYKNDPDKHDYYHAGIVFSTDPLAIVHCSGPGIVVDHALGKWNYRGWLRKVSQDAAPIGIDVETAVVTAPSGSTVNLRDKPDGKLVDRVPVGSTVTVAARQDGWARVSYAGKSGWMMDSFLESESAPPPGGDTVTVSLPRDLAEQLLAALQTAVEGGG